MKRYRIVKRWSSWGDDWRYVVQRKRWYWPFWLGVIDGIKRSQKEAEWFVQDGCPNHNREMEKAHKQEITKHINKP